jgi:hypothetical protein
VISDFPVLWNWWPYYSLEVIIYHLRVGNFKCPGSGGLVAIFLLRGSGINVE